MKTKANLAAITGLLVFAVSICAQTNQEATLPVVPGGDGVGSSIPSMSPLGDANGSVQVRAAAEARAAAAKDEKAATGAPAAGAAETSSRAAAAEARTPGTVLPATPAGATADFAERRPLTPLDEGAVTLDTSAMSKRIRSAAYNDRDALFTGLSAQLEDRERDIDEIKQTLPSLPASERGAFKRAAGDLSEARRALMRTLQTARKAGPGEWEKARSNLARAYEAYSVTLTQFEVTAPRAR